MNWLEPESSPRKRPPPSHGTQSIARIQPMVPEVSMFFSSDNFLHHDGEASEAEVVQPVRVNQPSDRPRIRSEASRPMVARETVESPRDDHEEKSCQPTSAPKVEIHANVDLYKLLQSQSEQIASLHEALRKLLGDRDEPRLKVRHMGVQTEPNERKLGGIERGIQCQPEEDLNPAQEPYLSPKGYQKGELSILTNDDLDESAEVLDQLQRACMRGQAPTPTGSAVAPKPTERDPLSDTVARLRQLGISFVDPAHLAPTKESRSSGHLFDSNYPLGLTAGVQAHGAVSRVQSITSDSSLAINSAALKYLDDQQLTALANRRLIQPSRGSHGWSQPVGEAGSGVTKYGLPHNQMSSYTQKYLEAPKSLLPRLMEPQRHANHDILENLTQMLQQPKLKP